MLEDKAKIRDFLSRYLRNHDLQDDDDIFALGFVNPLFAMQLVMYVESEFQVKIEDEDLDIDNFKSISAITELIRQKKERAAV